MKQKEYTFHEDPGHGWLEVPMDELLELNLILKISSYSYQSNFRIVDSKAAFLEEDCDASVFLEAKKAKGEDVKVVREYQDRTFIRELPAFGN